MRNKKSAAFGIGGALLVLGSALLAPTAARAGSGGDRNTAIGLGAAAAYELLHKQTLAGVALAAGAAYSAKRYEDARKSERDNQRRGYYYQPYSYQNNRQTYPNGGYQNNNYNYNGGYSGNYNGRRPYGNANDNAPAYNGNAYGYAENNSSDGRYHYDRYGNRIENSNYQNGRKQGWRGRDVPPGQWKKNQRDNDQDGDNDR